MHYCQAVTLLQDYNRCPIAGLISSENGAVGTINGWVQSALLGIPVIDAPCDGRAHPTGIMGSMGLHRDRHYVSVQAAVGSNGLAILVRGPLHAASSLVRQVAVQAGGLVAVARNPVSARYVQEHGAPGAIQQAVSVGRIIMGMRSAGGYAVVQALAKELGGSVYGPGIVEHASLITEGGFDHGTVILTLDNGSVMELTFWNEYMTLEQGGQRLATFPDLIATIDLDGLPCCSADVTRGQKLYILTVPYQRLILGQGVRDLAEYRRIEQVVQKPLIPYLQGKDGFIVDD